MGFLGDVFSSVVKVALTPVAIVKDVANISTGEKPNATKKLLQSAADDITEAGEDLGDGNFL